MFKKIMMASLAAGALALNAPAAFADTPTYDCDFNTVRQASATGQSFEGVSRGYVAHAEGGEVSIRCYVTVNDTEVSSTTAGTGTAFAVTAGQVSYVATAEDNVDLCAEVTTSHGSETTCVDTTLITVPPEEVLNLINSVLEQVDPTICPVIAEFEGTYGVIEINGEGDIDINGGGFYDCPPYDPIT